MRKKIINEDEEIRTTLRIRVGLRERFETKIALGMNTERITIRKRDWEGGGGK